MTLVRTLLFNKFSVGNDGSFICLFGPKFRQFYRRQPKPLQSISYARQQTFLQRHIDVGNMTVTARTKTTTTTKIITTPTKIIITPIIITTTTAVKKFATKAAYRFSRGFPICTKNVDYIFVQISKCCCCSLRFVCLKCWKLYSLRLICWFLGAISAACNLCGRRCCCCCHRHTLAYGNLRSAFAGFSKVLQFGASYYRRSFNIFCSRCLWSSVTQNVAVSGVNAIFLSMFLLLLFLLHKHELLAIRKISSGSKLAFWGVKQLSTQIYVSMCLYKVQTYTPVYMYVHICMSRFNCCRIYVKTLDLAKADNIPLYLRQMQLVRS